MPDITTLTATSAPGGGDVFYIVVDPGGVPADRKVTLANLAVAVSNLLNLNPVSAGWAATNVSTDRSFDANTTSLNELADVVGTLINDLKAAGVLDG